MVTTSHLMTVTDAVSHARSRGFLPQTTRYALDEATSRKIPTPVLNIILGFAFDGVERASKDGSALTKELQKKLIEVLPNKKFHFPQDQVARVFINVKSLYLMTPQNQLLKKLLKVTKDALFKEVAPKQGRVIPLLVKELEVQKSEVTDMLTKTVKVNESITPEARKAIAFFVSREVKVQIAALHEKLTDLKQMLLDEKLKDYALKGLSLKDMYEIQKEVKQCQFFAAQISAKVCQLAPIDDESAKELRQKYLDEIGPVLDSTSSSLLEVLKQMGKFVTGTVKSIYQDLQAPSIANDSMLQMDIRHFSVISELTDSITRVFHKLRMMMEFREKASTHDREGLKESVALSDLAAKRDQIMSALRMGHGHVKSLDPVTKEIEAMGEQAKRVRKSAQHLDFTDAYNGREKYAEVVGKFYDELTQVITDLLEQKHDAANQEIMRLRDSGQVMSISEKQKLEALMAALEKVNSFAVNAYNQAGQLLVLE